VPREPEYLSIATALRAEVLDGMYDDEGSLPGNAAIAQRFDVNLKTAGRAIQHLVAQGLLIARPGLRPVVAPPEQRELAWPMTGRYARARAARGLVFGGDVRGEVRKRTVRREWVPAPAPVAQLLRVRLGSRVLLRVSHTHLGSALAEATSMYFPFDVVRDARGLEDDDAVQVVALLEDAGHVVTRTANEVRARLASADEQRLFGVGPTAVVLEQTHGTYGARDEPLEAVVNVRPASDNVITFETYEGP
jgi:GntR family transcriptional regulator